jgi:hypothetical protein
MMTQDKNKNSSKIVISNEPFSKILVLLRSSLSIVMPFYYPEQPMAYCQQLNIAVKLLSDIQRSLPRVI